MAVSFRSLARKTWQTAASIKTGVILLILVVILAAAGTVILQRPMTEPEESSVPTHRRRFICSMPPDSQTFFTHGGLSD